MGPARTCGACGRTKPTAAFRDNNRACRHCHNRAVKARRAQRRDVNVDLRRDAGRRANARRARRRIVGAAAARFRQPYTAADVAVLLDPAVSHAAAAEITGRSYNAVALRRSVLWRGVGLAAPIRVHAASARVHPRATPPAAEPDHA
jgi:hypothetical protein